MAFARSVATFAAMLIAAPAAQAEEVTQVHAALSKLTRADLTGPSPRLLAMLERWFPRFAPKEPCGPAEGWLSSDAVCEWYAPGANTSSAIFPDMFMSLSGRSIDSVVFWGRMPLPAATWQCTQVQAKPVATVCIAMVLPAERRKTLLAEWETTLGRIAGAGQ